MIIRKSKIYSLNDIKVGSSDFFTVKISRKLINSFAALVGDYNPLHVNNEYAKNSVFKRLIAHGMLVSSFFSTFIGMYLPGRNSLIISQKIKYLKPVYINKKLFIKGVVKNISYGTKLITLDIEARAKYELFVVAEVVVLIL